MLRLFENLLKDSDATTTWKGELVSKRPKTFDILEMTIYLKFILRTAKTDAGPLKLLRGSYTP